MSAEKDKGQFETCIKAHRFVGDIMSNLKTQIRVTIVLGVFSLLAGLITHLALTDIYHGEADVTLEWSVVRICALVLLVFIGMALFILRRALRELT
jgi:hypothetical protein